MEIENYAKGCEAILDRLENNVSPHYAETVEELERRHDYLEEEVRNLAGMLRGLALAVAKEVQPQTSPSGSSKGAEE